MRITGTLLALLLLTQTAWALNGVPSWNLTPCCSSKVQVLAPLLEVQDLARLGSISVEPGLVFTRPS